MGNPILKPDHHPQTEDFEQEETEETESKDKAIPRTLCFLPYLLFKILEATLRRNRRRGKAIHDKHLESKTTANRFFSIDFEERNDKLQKSRATRYAD